MSVKTVLSGVCHYMHADVSEWGASWTFQDERYMGIRADHYVRCSLCDLDWNKQTQLVPPVPACSKQQLCTHNWVLDYPEGRWMPEGSYILNEGDQLTIFSKEDRKVLWSGKIKYTPKHQHGPHLQAGALCYQAGVDRNKWQEWFYDQYPAELVLGGSSLDQRRKLNERDRTLKEEGRD